MKRTLATLSIVLAPLVSAGGSALAWDGPQLWYERADAASPGGGGIFGTGGARDHDITCEHCHVDRPLTQIDAAFTFTPALAEVAGVKRYAPDQTYQIRVDLIGEAEGLSGCGPYTTNVNNFAATFEDAQGRTAGALTSDSGQTQTSCPADYTDPPSGTTALYRDCEVIFGKGEAAVDTWWFAWRAPPPGSGSIRLSYGIVDGDCTMMSMGDAVKVGQLDLAEGAAVARPRRTSPIGLAALSIAGLLLAAARRRRGAAPLAGLLAVSLSCGGSDSKEDGTLGGACLPGDVCMAGLVCDDGVCVQGGGRLDGGGPVDASSAPIDAAAPIGQRPSASINHPGDGETRPAGQAIPFIGAATDAEDGALSGGSLVWTSDLAGQFGTGDSFDAVLGAGVHVITLTATDSDGNAGSDSITITVQ